MSYNTQYIDTPQLTKTVPSGGKDKGKTMSKSTNTSEPKAKKYNKTRGEHVKDIVIAILVTSIIAFVLGMQFADSQNARVDEAVNAVTSVHTDETAQAKK